MDMQTSSSYNFHVWICTVKECNCHQHPPPQSSDIHKKLVKCKQPRLAGPFNH